VQLRIDCRFQHDRKRLSDQPVLYKGVKKKDAESFRKKMHYYRGMPVTVNKDSIAQSMLLPCNTKRYQLKIVIIERTDVGQTYPLKMGFILEQK
jgi:hypothetical protein